jgi:hypothetical protein
MTAIHPTVITATVEADERTGLAAVVSEVDAADNIASYFTFTQ